MFLTNFYARNNIVLVISTQAREMRPPRGIEYFVQGPYYKCAGSLKDPSIEEYDKLLTLVKKRQLRWFGNVTMSGLAKMTLQDIVKSERRRGKKR